METILDSYKRFMTKNYDEVVFWKDVMCLIGDDLTNDEEEYVAHCYSELMNAYLFSDEFKYQDYIIPIFYGAFKRMGKKKVEFVPINLLRILDTIAPLPKYEDLEFLGNMKIDYISLWCEMTAKTIVQYLNYLEDNKKNK